MIIFMRILLVRSLLILAFIFPVYVSGSEKSQVHTNSDQNRECFEARKMFTILKMQRPIYVDDQGNYRPQWKYDPYKGERAYIDDESRELELDRTLKKLKRFCSDPHNEKEMKQALVSVIKEAKCASAHADLEFLKRSESRSSKQKIRTQEDLVRLFCEP